MNITVEGRRLVNSTDFALRIKTILADYYAEGIDEETGRGIAVSLIAWAVVGGDLECPPQTDEQRVELAQFIHAHAAEVNSLADKCFENIVKHDTDGKIH